MTTIEILDKYKAGEPLSSSEESAALRVGLRFENLMFKKLESKPTGNIGALGNTYNQTILNVIRANGPMTASAVIQALSNNTQLKPFTIRWNLSRMKRKGLLRKEGKAYLLGARQ